MLSGKMGSSASRETVAELDEFASSLDSCESGL
jgi:hypothetical protein